MSRFPADSSVPGYLIRDVTDPWEMRELEDVQAEAWAYAERELLPATMFRISSVTGGIVLGAYPEAGGPAVGLAYGFPALREGELWHHSHLLALRAGARRSGLAVALKLAQRERVLAQGLTRMTWTFDPLVPRNARLNFGKLEVTARHYLRDWYALGDRASAVPADRLLVSWDLTRPPTGHPPLPPHPQDEPVLLTAGSGPGEPQLGAQAPRLLAEVPVLPQSGPALLAWRLGLRAVLEHYLSGEYVVTDLLREGDRAFYLLVKNTGEAPPGKGPFAG